MKKCVLFYSLTNNTKDAADKISKTLGIPAFEVETVKPMPEEFNKQIMYGGMLVTFKICPKIKELPKELNEFDEIILGMPVWASAPAAAINTVLKNKGLREKVTAVFTLSGGGDNEKCVAKLKKVLPNLKTTVALADKKNSASEDNEKRLEDFIGKL